MKMDPLGTLFGHAWRFYKERFWVLTQIFIVPALIVGIGDLMIARGPYSATLLGGVINFIGAIASVLGSLALISAVGSKTDFGKSYGVGFRLFWSTIWISILNFFAICGGFVLLVVPGIFLSIAFIFANYVLVLEGKHGIAALMQSKTYVKGHWWEILGRGIVLALVFFVIMLLIHVPAVLAFGIITGGFVNALLLMFLLPFFVCYSYAMYENVRRIKSHVGAEPIKKADTLVKVCMVVGVIALLVLAIFIGVAGKEGFLMREGMPGNYYGGGMGTATSTIAVVSPTSGPVGAMVTITFPTAVLGNANSVFMNGLVAARNVASPDGKLLSFTVPSSLAPNCAPNMMCPQFLLHVGPSIYAISVATGPAGTMPNLTAGNFTVTSGSGSAPYPLY
jgi:hypothetical protein